MNRTSAYVSTGDVGMSLAKIIEIVKQHGSSEDSLHNYTASQYFSTNQREKPISVADADIIGLFQYPVLRYD